MREKKYYEIVVEFGAIIIFIGGIAAFVKNGM